MAAAIARRSLPGAIRGEPRRVASLARCTRRTPTVFLIARPSIDLEGMRAYLRDVGGESWLERRARARASERARTRGELLVEFGGRACYRSWEPGPEPQRHARCAPTSRSTSPTSCARRTAACSSTPTTRSRCATSRASSPTSSSAIAPARPSARRACATCASPTSASACRPRSSRCASRCSRSSSSSRSFR